MRNYQSDESKSWHWVKRQEYIPASDALGNGEVLGWKLIEKFPVEKIKHDPNNYPNKLDLTQVLDMTIEFFPFGFYPIRIDSNGNLKDGLHRLMFAKWSCLKYIDVFVE